MNTLFTDTHPKMEALQIQVIQRMSASKKMDILNGLNETVRTLALSGIKQRHPNATPAQTQRMLAELMLGEELARKVYDHAK